VARDHVCDVVAPRTRSGYALWAMRGDVVDGDVVDGGFLARSAYL
jgi:hypothetical protein